MSDILYYNNVDIRNTNGNYVLHELIKSGPSEACRVIARKTYNS